VAGNFPFFHASNFRGKKQIFVRTLIWGFNEFLYISFALLLIVFFSSQETQMVVTCVDSDQISGETNFGIRRESDNDFAPESPILFPWGNE